MDKNKKSLFIGIRYLFNVFWTYQRSALVFLFLHCLIGGVLPFAAIVIPKFILDELLSTRDVYTLIGFTAVLLLCMLFGNSLLNILDVKFILGRMRCSQGYFRNRFLWFYEADIERLESPTFHDWYRRMVNFLNPDDGSGFGGVIKKVTIIISQGITLAGIVAIISFLHPLILLLFIGLTVINALASSRVKKLNNKYRMESADLDRRCIYTESLFYDRRFAKEARVNVLGGWIIKIMQNFWDTFNVFHKKTNYNNLKSQLFSNVISFIQQGVAYAYLIYSVLDGHFGVGSFTMYLAAINAFSGAMFALMDSVVDIRRFSDFYSAVEELDNMPRTQREGKQLPLKKDTAPVFEFRNVSFKYPGQEGYALRNINLKFDAGEKVSIVGENGAGKTTMTKLLMRLYRPTEGQILLNGIDVQDYDFEEYEELFSAVFQDFALYSMPLRDNVATGRDVSDEKIRAALVRSGFGDRLNTLSKGLDTYVYKEFNENGFEPSGGEGQKIAIARALLRDAPVVVLDEPTAALDPRAEYEIYQNFNEMVKGKTAIFISHRLSSARFCDKVAVFKQGEVVECGSHDELMKQDGLYHELFTMQAQFYEGETGNENA